MHHSLAAVFTTIAMCSLARTGFAGCDGKELGHVSYGTIKAEVYRLDSIIPRYETLFDRLLACGANGEMPPRDIYERLVDLDINVERLGAELILKERSPDEMQEQIDRIHEDLRELKAVLRKRSVREGSFKSVSPVCGDHFVAFPTVHE